MNDTHPLLRFLTYLPKGGDSELSILKCHLLVEEVLARLIERHMKQKDFLPKARLAFVQKVALARGLNDLPPDEWVWNAVSALNEARNALAHNLDQAVLSKKVDAFIAAVESTNGMPDASVLSGPLGRFQWAAYHVYTYLAVRAHFQPRGSKNLTILGAMPNNSLERTREG